MLRVFGLGFVVLLAIATVALWQNRATLQQVADEIEYRRAFIPTVIQSQDVGSFPASCRITGIEWKNDRRAYCATVSFQMACAAEGRRETLEYLNWLTGYTYGASFYRDLRYFHLGSHSQAGIAFAAPFLGLKRVYLAAPDRETFVRAVKAQVARGKPVEIGHNGNTLYGQSGFSPHSNLIAGYNERSFFVYETSVNAKTVRSSPATGNLVAVDQVVKAVEEMNGQVGSYTLTIFEEGPKQQAWKAVWRRNGRLLIGRTMQGQATGAEGIEAAAARIRHATLSEEEGWWLRFMLEWGGYARRDNARLIRSLAPEIPLLQHAAILLEQAGALLVKAHDRTNSQTGEVLDSKRVAEWLEQVAAKEREAGELMVRYSEL